MKQCSLLLLVFLLVANTVFSQHTLLKETPVPPVFLSANQVGRFNPPVLNSSLTETLNQVFDTITALSSVKGISAAMLLPDGSVWKRASGLAEALPVSVPLSTEHLMGMGSISKSFVATALLLMYEDGLVDLDDSIGQYVGPYPNVPGSVSIRQLLSHTSGISDFLNENPAMDADWAANLDSIWIADTILNHYVLAPNFPPGTAWSYSNTNYLLAGRIIERITGKPWYQVVRERVIDPLGLTHTFVYPWETPGDQPFSHAWTDLDGDGTVEDFQGLGLPVEGRFSMAGSAGCLISTPEDLVRFSEKVYGGHVLQAATLAEMETDYVQNDMFGLYGLGTASFPLPEQIENWGHNGDLTYKSLALYFPSENMALAVQQNDDREFDPSAAEPVLDYTVVYITLLDAYLNYLSPTATDEAELNENRVAVYPNPAGQSVHLVFPENTHLDFPVRCELTDMSGRTVLTQIIDREEDEVLTGPLPAGEYALHVGKFAGKIIRQ